MERLRDQVSPHLLISEIRTIAADDLWLNWLHFRPARIWGKLFTMSPEELKSSYKKLPDFIQLSKKYDPQGKFRNEFLSTNIFSS